MKIMIELCPRKIDTRKIPWVLFIWEHVCEYCTEYGGEVCQERTFPFDPYFRQFSKENIPKASSFWGDRERERERERSIYILDISLLLLTSVYMQKSTWGL